MEELKNDTLLKTVDPLREGNCKANMLGKKAKFLTPLAIFDEVHSVSFSFRLSLKFPVSTRYQEPDIQV
jgi:hypothetical protein